jgi:hypothetical protein
MADLFNAIKRRDTISFPRFEDFYDPFGKCFLCIFAEYNQSTRKMQYTHSPSTPDDAFHSTLLAFLISCMEHTKPHFFAPVDVRGPGPMVTFGGA